MTTQQNAHVLAKHRDEAAKAAGFDNWRDCKTWSLADGRVRSSVEVHAQTLANLEAANNRLAEIDQIAHTTDRGAAHCLNDIRALASDHTPSPCPSCAEKDEAMEAMRATITEAMDLGVSEEVWDVLKPYRTPPADPVAEALKDYCVDECLDLTEQQIDAVVAWAKSRLPLGGAK